MTISLGHTPRTLLFLLLATALAWPIVSSAESSTPRTWDDVQIAVHGESNVLHGGPAAPTGGLARSVLDSFNIYGGRRSDGSNNRLPEGQFQDFILFPDAQNWFGVDLTEQPTYWNVSTFNADNLDPGAGNQAYWSGVPAGTSGFLTAPGYGNNWNDILEWSAPANPTINTNVRLQFVFNYELEPAYDFFVVEYDSAGTWLPFQAPLSGSNRDGVSGDFIDPAIFDQTVLFTPLMYTGSSGQEVRLRIRVTSDGAYSDEDGLFPSRGAAQIDNVVVSFNGVASTPVVGGDGVATFENVGPGVDDTEGWTPVSAAYAGNFSKVLIQLRDIDPCRDNLTPMLSFIDDGTPPSNAPNEPTGGSLSTTWDYGVRGGWVVNYTGGISDGEVPLANEWWSPEIAWDDSTTTEDDGLEGGALIRFTVWQHLPLQNGMFWVWHVRSKTASGDWSPWRDRNFVYYGDGGGVYNNTEFIVTDLLEPDPEFVQVALGVTDLAGVFGFPGDDATPSPCFDNVSVWRFQSPGPAFAAREIDLFQDGFAASSAFGTGDLAALSVRMDAALDINGQGTAIVPGDSIVADVTAAIPGTQLAGTPSLKWVLEANPLFDGVRQIPAGATNMGPGARGWTRWMGTVAGDSSRTAGGTAIADRFFFDLPNDGDAQRDAPHQVDEDAMFFPGDVIRYFLEATDTGANTSTIPADTTGFLGTDAAYSRVFTVKALPTIENLAGDQPDILVWNDFGSRGNENDFIGAFGQLGMFEGFDFDTYTTRGPSSLVSNGLGATGAGGATPDQLKGYRTIIYLAGDLQEGLISDGSNENGNDKAADTAVMQQWTNLEGDRNVLHFGDNIAGFMSTSGAVNATYLATVMGTAFNSASMRTELGGLSTPIVRPNTLGTSLGLSTDIMAYGGCIALNQFDSIQPLGAADTLYDLVSPDSGTAFPSPSGAVYFEQTRQNPDQSTSTLRSITFPFGFNVTYNPPGYVAVDGKPARAYFLQELLEMVTGAPVGNPGNATATDVPRVLRVDDNVPNPFNPVTKISFSAPRAGEVAVRVYNLRGELVRTLLDGRVEAGRRTVEWNGTDDRGAAVASGVYLYRVDGFGQTITRKMALVK